ncbi:hypothetical protein PIIN_07937 [Serendipita indica DSM 11827]|uniref:Uncharacterized protein n=1 Tax=Serendipita indica (strain DSM 11827) TaxID=1109443 RepID=G4TRP0_SERID|nr:hypothetical protein PIIN_07937 [Serendipita indica DSM 11827]
MTVLFVWAIKPMIRVYYYSKPAV